VENEKFWIVETCKNALEMAESYPSVLDAVVSLDEPWYFEYSPQTNHQSTDFTVVSTNKKFGSKSQKPNKEKSVIRNLLQMEEL
jgi:hypothetical protein